MDEIWKQIKGYEGFYEVSNMGRVRSMSFRNNQTVFPRVKILSSTDNGYGYKIVGLTKNGERKNGYVHRLVAEAFIPNPYNLPVIDHIDHNRGNNRADNLRWLTQRENVKHSIGLMSKPRKKVTSNTGEKYISKIANGSYKVSLPWLRFWRQYDTLEKAIAERDKVLHE